MSLKVFCCNLSKLIIFFLEPALSDLDLIKRMHKEPGNLGVNEYKVRYPYIKGVPAKKRPAETLNYSKSKTCRARKLFSWSDKQVGKVSAF